MKTKDTIDLEGILKIYKGSAQGRQLVYNGENLITLACKQFLLSLIYTFPSTSSDPVVNLKIGTGGTVDPQGQFPKVEDPTWTNLNVPLLTTNTSFVVTNADPSVKFLADIDQFTANGSLITEAGLFRNSGAIFNVKTFPGIPKTSDFSLHFEWTIKFS